MRRWLTGALSHPMLLLGIAVLAERGASAGRHGVLVSLITHLWMAMGSLTYGSYSAMILPLLLFLSVASSIAPVVLGLLR